MDDGHRPGPRQDTYTGPRPDAHGGPRPDVYDTIAAVPEATWDALAGTGDVDRRHAYLRFRERMEPGTPTVVMTSDHDGPLGALHGCATTDRTALFSHPWKMLADDQMLRAGSDDELARRRDRRTALVERLIAAAGRPAPPGPQWRRLSTALGPALVVRGHDTSEVVTRADADADAVADALLAEAQRRVAGTGAVVLPYVRPRDAPLRRALRARGFRMAVLTASSHIPTGGARTFADFLATLPGRKRYAYRDEGRAFDATGHTVGVLPLADAVDTVVRLELATMAKYGSGVDPGHLRAARRFLAAHAGDLVRVPAVRDAAGPFACGLHLVGARDYIALTFGSDYRHTGAAAAGVYHRICFQEPVSYACDHGLDGVRLGFEGFHAKVLRGAVVSPLETWFWVPDPAVLRALAEVYSYVDRCAAAWLARYTGATTVDHRDTDPHRLAPARQ